MSCLIVSLVTDLRILRAWGQSPAINPARTGMPCERRSHGLYAINALKIEAKHARDYPAVFETSKFMWPYELPSVFDGLHTLYFSQGNFFLFNILLRLTR